ncbi:MAG: CDP-diacylglycerol--glycerol-3-phosphate 3-phosphatidyltransferase [Gammaproteobacteria bacterium]
MILPNILSISRILLLAPIIIFFENGFFLLSTITFILASITDFLDGYIARKNNQTSDTGALLDLLSDKIFVSVLLIWMTFNFESLVILLSTILIVTREISISYLRLFILSRSREIKDTKADSIGKFKTTLQMFSLGLLLLAPLLHELFYFIFLGLILLSSLISWYSFVRYSKKWIV